MIFSSPLPSVFCTNLPKPNQAISTALSQHNIEYWAQRNAIRLRVICLLVKPSGSLMNLPQSGPHFLLKTFSRFSRLFLGKRCSQQIQETTYVPFPPVFHIILPLLYLTLLCHHLPSFLLFFSVLYFCSAPLSCPPLPSPSLHTSFVLSLPRGGWAGYEAKPAVTCHLQGHTKACHHVLNSPFPPGRPVSQGGLSAKGKKGLDLEGTTVRDDSRERKEHFKDRVRRALVYRQEYGMKLQESRYCGLTGFNLEENIDVSEERYKTQQWRNCKHYSIVWNNEERCEWVILSRVESWWGRCNPRRDPSGLPNLCWSG